MSKPKESIWENIAREAGNVLVELGKKIDQAIADADGDIIEAMHGHKCGPDCWHKMKPKDGSATSRPEGFVCDGTCAGNELGDCNHVDSNDGLRR